MHLVQKCFFSSIFSRKKETENYYSCDVRRTIQLMESAESKRAELKCRFGAKPETIFQLYFLENV